MGNTHMNGELRTCKNGVSACYFRTVEEYRRTIFFPTPSYDYRQPERLESLNLVLRVSQFNLRTIAYWHNRFLLIDAIDCSTSRLAASSDRIRSILHIWCVLYIIFIIYNKSKFIIFLVCKICNSKKIKYYLIQYTIYNTSSMFLQLISTHLWNKHKLEKLLN